MSTTTHDTGSEGLVEQTKSELADAASTVQDKALELKQQGRSKLGETLDRRTTEAGGQARQAARALRQSGSQLRTQADGKGEQVAQAAEWAADRVERLGGTWNRRVESAYCVTPRTSPAGGRGWWPEPVSSRAWRRRAS